MKLEVFSVYDVKAEAFIAPFFMSTIAQAIRAFSEACSQEGHAFRKHAEDYTLFHIGSFNDGTAEIKAIVPIRVAAALEFVSPTNVVSMVKEA